MSHSLLLLMHLTPSDSDHRFVVGLDIIPRLFPEGSIPLEYLLSGEYGHVGSPPAHAAILPAESPVARSSTPAVLEQQLLSELESPFSGDSIVVDTHTSTSSLHESVRPHFCLFFSFLLLRCLLCLYLAYLSIIFVFLVYTHISLTLFYEGRDVVASHNIYSRLAFCLRHSFYHILFLRCLVYACYALTHSRVLSVIYSVIYLGSVVG